VLAALKEHHGIIGGETSGHVICLDKTTTGDGIIAALQALAAVREAGSTLADLVAGMDKYPQKLVNVRVRERIDVASNASICAAVREVEKKLGSTGRVVLRASGTEPLIRVMVEAEDEDTVDEHSQWLASVVAEAASAG
jgi:phosphoglucosamine mutase